MKIGIDGRMLGPKQGGLGRYIEQLVLELEKLDLPAEFVVFLRKENWNAFEPSRPNFTKVLADVPWYGLSEQLLLPIILRKHPVDLMHFPHWNVPLLYNRPFVVTVHDLLLLHYPSRRASTLSSFSYLLKKLGYHLTLRHAIRKARKILTVSRFSQHDIEITLKVPGNKIVVSYPAPLPLTKKKEHLPEKFGIKKPFALYVGVAYPHKNLERLLTAWNLFSGKTGGTHQLVLAGGKNYFYERLLAQFAPQLKTGQVVFTDFVSDDELAALYHHASLYVFPSLYEGFGIPPLEAMSCGVPVVSSNAASLPEVLEGAALYFNPENPAEIASALESGFFDEKLRSELSRLGFDLVAKYSWKKLAETTFETYQNSV